MIYINIMKNTIIRNIPDDIHRDFKVMCAKKGVSINQELIRLMKEAVDKEGKKGTL